MASQTVDPINWPLPPTLMGSTPCAPCVQYKLVQPWLEIDLATFSTRGNHLAYATTQGIKAYGYAATQALNVIDVRPA